MEGHFRVPSQDVPETLVGEPDLVPMLIGETLHAGPHHRIPYPKVYREKALNDKNLSSNSSVVGCQRK